MRQSWKTLLSATGLAGIDGYGSKIAVFFSACHRHTLSPTLPWTFLMCRWHGSPSMVRHAFCIVN